MKQKIIIVDVDGREFAYTGKRRESEATLIDLVDSFSAFSSPLIAERLCHDLADDVASQMTACLPDIKANSRIVTDIRDRHPLMHLARSLSL